LAPFPPWHNGDGLSDEGAFKATAAATMFYSDTFIPTHYVAHRFFAVPELWPGTNVFW
jgi:hypothetical protein